MIDNQATELFSIPKSCDSVVDAAYELLTGNEFQVIRSFDLQLARAGHDQCTCPYHGTELCDCQMIVLLIYGLQEMPAALVIHGHDGWTHLSLVNSPGQEVSTESMRRIKKILSPVTLKR